ncbi:unnamed protein product, partial [Rotaria sordida]
MSMWYSIGTIMGYGADFHVQTAAGRLLTIGLYLLSLVLMATYTANLASDLTISKSKDTISGIDDIKNGKIPFSRIGILVESSQEDYYLREISEGVRNYYPLKTQDELYSSLLNNLVDASILDTSAIEYYTNNIYFNLTFVEKDFAPSSYGIAYPKQWLYGKDLDVIILSLRESGVLDDLKEKWFDKNVCQHSSSSYVSTSIKLEEMSGLFVTFGLISILSNSIRRLDLQNGHCLKRDRCFNSEQCAAFLRSSWAKQCEILEIVVNDQSMIDDLVNDITNLKALKVMLQPGR